MKSLSDFRLVNRLLKKRSFTSFLYKIAVTCIISIQTPKCDPEWVHFLGQVPWTQQVKT